MEGCGAIVWKGYWDLAQFPRLLSGGCFLETYSQSSLLSVIRAVIMDYLTYSLCLSSGFSPESGAKTHQKHKTNLEKYSVVAPFVHDDVLSSLATKLNLNSSNLSLSPLFAPWCVFISHPRNVVLLLCACVNKGCVRTWRIEAGGHRGFTVMSIKEKQNMKKGQSTAAQADPTLNRLLTCLSC